MQDQRAITLMALTVAMPFIAGFHVNMGAPWMLTGVLVNVICIGLFYSTVRDAATESAPDPQGPSSESVKKPVQR